MQEKGAAITIETKTIVFIPREQQVVRVWKPGSSIEIIPGFAARWCNR